jgi:MFS family permease
MKNGTKSTSPDGLRSHVVVPGAWSALVLLIGINIFNFVDRQVLAAVEPQVQRYFFPDTPEREPTDPNASFKMGVLAFAFLATYTLTAPLFGWLAGRMSRWLLVGIGVGVWSLASGASGLATTYWAMLATRCLVGIGEAVYGPVAPDVISDLFPVSRRGVVLSFFYAAIPVGGALGYALGDGVVQLMGEEHWRWAFYLVVPPGLALTLCCFFMKEPPRGLTDGVAQATRRVTLADYKILLGTHSYVLNCLGMAAMSFAIGGMAYWMPAFLEERHVEPVFGMSPKTAFGVFTVLAGLFATLAGGYVGDLLKPHVSGSYFLVSGIALVLAAPLILLMVWLPFPAAWIALVAGEVCLFFNTGPTNTILANVTHPQLRAPAFALNILVIHLLGDAPSPMIMGWIRDRTPGQTLDLAFEIVSVTALLGGVLWMWGTRYLARDTVLAPTRLG